MLSSLPPGVRTDLQILLLQGGVVEDRGDHLVIRAPHNPEYHWGNYVQVTTGDPDNAEHWLEVFRREHPDAAHIALGLPRMPSAGRYEALGLEVGSDESLLREGLPHDRPLPEGYTARPLATDADWEQLRVAAALENSRTGLYEPVGHDRFIRNQLAARRALVEAGQAAFVGAFHGDDLVSDLGIVVLGDEARYQSVGTDALHRRRGLAGHLLGLAARWAGERGARRFVIVTETTNAAGRLYRSVGFEPAEIAVQAYRRPPR